MVCCNYYVVNLSKNCIFDCSYCFLQDFLNNNPLQVAYVNIEDLLQELEGEADLSGSNTGYQLHMLPGLNEDQKLDQNALQELRDLDLQNMTPLDAINALARLQEQLTVPSD